MNFELINDKEIQRVSQGEIPPPHVQMLQMISAFWLSRSIYAAAGFRLTRVVHTASPMSIVEGEPA